MLYVCVFYRFVCVHSICVCVLCVYMHICVCCVYMYVSVYVCVCVVCVYVCVCVCVTLHVVAKEIEFSSVSCFGRQNVCCFTVAHSYFCCQ